MHDIELISNDRGTPSPRHAHEEIADLLSAALLRLRTRNSSSDDPDKSGIESRFALASPTHSA
jgi:hypothetical protein